MSAFFEIHPDNPQGRLVQQVAEIIRGGGIVVYPTDSSYAIGCHLDDKRALERIQRIRQVDKHHNFTLMCRDLSELGNYAKVGNQAFRLLKSHTPGPYTFIFSATSQVPRRLAHPKKKTIGLRVPDCNITLAILEALGEPMLSTTLILPNVEWPELVDVNFLRDQLENAVDAIIEGGQIPAEPTTVVDLTRDVPEVTRYGRGAADWE
ncbi:Sua5/YciO/YrdC/YwlC family protein [gamma proteobacterium HTCC5015]|nr:Sua5/YciO/YrdC/YwlC family protein [gamma proteobacterium HTCC5015]